MSWEIYRPGMNGYHRGRCRLCGDEKLLITDHCHSHGYIRGSLCFSCNGHMAIHDRRHPEGEECWPSGDYTCMQAWACPVCLRATTAWMDNWPSGILGVQA